MRSRRHLHPCSPWLPPGIVRRPQALRSASVSITSADQLTRELFTYLGAGTLVRRGERVHVHEQPDAAVMADVAERVEQSFGRALGDFGVMQGKLADMYTALQSSRAFAYRVAEDYDTGRKSRIDSAACLLHASRSAVEVGLEAIQSLGGNGYINEYPAGRILRDAKLYEIGAGTNEIRRMLIGRELLAGKH